MVGRGSGKGILSVFSLRSGEGRRAFLAALYLFLIIACYLTLKAVRDTLFLDEFGAQNLPYVKIALPLGVSLFVAIYTRLAQRIAPQILIIGTLGANIACLLVFWSLALRDVTWLYPVFYVWVGMFGVIASAQVWTLAGDLFTVREAKRVFGLIGGGGILGGIAGSFGAQTLVEKTGTLWTLPLVCGLLCLTILVVHLLTRTPAVQGPAHSAERIPGRISESLRMIAGTPHLRAIASLVLLTALVTSIVEWQFQAVAGHAYQGKELASFLLFFYALSSTASITVQLLLTSRIIRWLGLGGSLLILPVCLLAGTAALLAQVRLWAAVLARGLDQSLKHSLDRASRELLFLPLSRQVKLPVKSAIDMVVDRFGDGFAGVILLVLLKLMASGDPLEGVFRAAVLNVLLIAVWVFLALRLRTSYHSELARSIASGRMEITTWSEALAGSETTAAIEQALASPREEVVLEALDLVSRNPQWKIDTPLLGTLRSSNPEIQARAMSILLDPGDESLPEGLARRFGLEDQEILTECLDILLAAEGSERRERIETLLSRAGGTARGTWIVLLVRRLGPEYLPFAQKLVSSLLEAGNPPSAREVAAAAIGNMPPGSGMHEWLPRLLKDDDLRVAGAAATSAGSVGGSKLLEGVVPLLGHTVSRTAARRALQRRGGESVPVLRRWVLDPCSAEIVRLRIPAVLAGIGNSEAIACLIELLASPALEMVEQASLALRSLGGVERGVSSARFVRDRTIALAEQCRSFHERANRLRSGLRRTESRYGKLLLEALSERESYCRRLVFRVLCLLHPPNKIIPLWRGLASDDPTAHANATEILEGLGPRRLGRALLPLLATVEPQGTGSDAVAPWEPALLALIEEPNAWLGQLASQLAQELAIPRQSEETVAAMSVVDKVIALRKVELFGEIPGEELARVAALALKQSFSPEEFLCEQDDPAGDLFVLLEGEVLVERDGQALGRLGPGEALGAWGLFDEEPRQASAKALCELNALRIDRWGFDELLNEHPEIARSFIRRLVQKMRRLAGR